MGADVTLPSVKECRTRSPSFPEHLGKQNFTSQLEVLLVHHLECRASLSQETVTSTMGGGLHWKERLCHFYPDHSLALAQSCIVMELFVRVTSTLKIKATSA